MLFGYGMKMYFAQKKETNLKKRVEFTPYYIIKCVVIV